MGSEMCIRDRSVAEVDLGSGILSSVDLDFEDVVLLLPVVSHEVHLGVGDDSDNRAVLFDSVELGFELLGVLGDLGVVVREGLLLGVHPVLVESSLGSDVQMVAPDGGEGSEASGGFDVADQTDDSQRRGFDDGDGFDLLLLVQFGLGSVDVSQDVGHASLESTESSEVARLGLVVPGEASYSSSVVSGSSSGHESQVALSGAREFSMRHLYC